MSEMTAAERALAKTATEWDGQVTTVGDVLRIFGFDHDWRDAPDGTIIAFDFTRIGSESTLLVKRRREMTRVEGIMAVNRELRTGERVQDPAAVITDVLGGLFLEDVKATPEEVQRRREAIAADRAEAKRAKEMLAEQKRTAKAGAMLKGWNESA